MRAKLFGFIACACLVLSALPIVAHHAFSAEFDATKPLKLEGAITEVEWINPHTWIHIQAKSAAGKTEEWMIEGGTPNTLLRRGFTEDSLRSWDNLSGTYFHAGPKGLYIEGPPTDPKVELTRTRLTLRYSVNPGAGYVAVTDVYYRDR